MIEVGARLEPIAVEATLTTSVMYAGASGDFNPLHYDPAFAAEVSPTGDVIAHGMFSMGLVSRALADFAGGPDKVEDVSVRFTRPWPVGTTSTFEGEVTEVSDGVAVVKLWGDNDSGTRILRGTGRVRV